MAHILNRVSRRWFIRRAAVAAPIAALGGAGASIVATQPEHLDLLGLSHELDAAVAVFAASAARKRNARLAFDALCPPVPDELVMRRHPYFNGAFNASRHGEFEQDVEGHHVYPDNLPQRRIFTADGLARLIQDHGAGPRTKAGRDLRQRLKSAQTYEALVGAASEASGISAAIEAVYWAAYEINRVAEAICAAPALSFAGIEIKARAMQAMEQSDEKGFRWRAGRHGEALYKSILDVAGREVP